MTALNTPSDTLPKVELHVHLEGTIQPALARRLALRNKVAVQEFTDESGAYKCDGFDEFLKLYDKIAALMTGAPDYQALICDYLIALAGEGTIYAEIAFSPDHGARCGLAYPEFVEALGEGIESARIACGIEARLIVTGVRHHGPEAVELAANDAASHPHPLVVGFGLAGNEREGHARDFASAFRRAAACGLRLTAHAGEFGGPQSVRDALDHLGIERVGHGVRAIEDRDLVQRLAQAGTVLEICPSSNVFLGLYENIPAHPVDRLLRAGCAVTLNSDDPPFFGTSLGREYDRCARAFGWDESVMRKITANAIAGAFCDDELKDRLLTRLAGDDEVPGSHALSPPFAARSN